jgi:hypothetical protein
MQMITALDPGEEDTMKSRVLTETDLRSLAAGSAQKRLAHVGSLANVPRTISMASGMHTQALPPVDVKKRKLKLHGGDATLHLVPRMLLVLFSFGIFASSTLFRLRSHTYFFS